MDFYFAYGSFVLGRAVFNASGCVACVPCLRPFSPFRSWSVMAGMILCVYKHFIWMKHQTGKKQFLWRTCHAVLVTRTAVKDHRALTCEDGALSQFGLADAGRSFAAVNQRKSLFLFNFRHVSAGPVP